jgi:hypothetical protein
MPSAESVGGIACFTMTIFDVAGFITVTTAASAAATVTVIVTVTAIIPAAVAAATTPYPPAQN